MLFPSIRSPTKIRAPAGFEGEIYSGFARKCQKEGEEKKRPKNYESQKNKTKMLKQKQQGDNTTIPRTLQKTWKSSTKGQVVSENTTSFSSFCYTFYLTFNIADHRQIAEKPDAQQINQRLRRCTLI